MNAVIIPATGEDAAAIDTLVNSAYRGDSSKQDWTTEADLLDGGRTDADHIREIMQKPGTTLLKYVDNREILACMELRQEGQKLYLGMLTVQPNLQGKGIGKELLKAAEAEAPEIEMQDHFHDRNFRQARTHRLVHTAWLSADGGDKTVYI